MEEQENGVTEDVTQEAGSGSNEGLKNIISSAEGIEALVNPPKNGELVSKKNKKVGLYLIAGPFIGVAVSLFGIVLIRVLKGLMVGETLSGEFPTGSIVDVVGNLITWLLMIIGIVSAIGSAICIPVGIIFYFKRVVFDDVKYDERSGKGANSTVPEEIRSWNWGAAGLNWIWGISHSVWIALLALIPFVNIAMFIVLGIKGNEWAWRKQKWESVDEFIAYQKKWKPWGIAFFTLGVFFTLLRILGSK